MSWIKVAVIIVAIILQDKDPSILGFLFWLVIFFALGEIIIEEQKKDEGKV